MSKLILGGKRASETLIETFDFASLLAVGETLSTATVTAAVYSGTDASPGSLISGSASISGTKVTQKITAGTAGVVYTLTCSVTTLISAAAAQTLKLDAMYPVMP